jgi:hypothetical protein
VQRQTMSNLIKIRRIRDNIAHLTAPLHRLVHANRAFMFTSLEADEARFAGSGNKEESPRDV